MKKSADTFETNNGQTTVEKTVYKQYTQIYTRKLTSSIDRSISSPDFYTLYAWKATIATRSDETTAIRPALLLMSHRAPM